MLIDEILDGFGNNGPASAYQFETFILNLLKYHIENQNKVFAVSEGRAGFGDAVAENGFDEFTGKTVIEIKYSVSRVSFSHLFKKLIDVLNTVDSLPDVKNIIIITARSASFLQNRTLLNDVQNISPKIKITIWGPEELNKLVSKHRKHTSSIVNNLFALRLESAVSKGILDWKKDREPRLNDLRDSYERGQFSFFLGAGVSSSAGMPDWNTLLNSLFVSYLANEFIKNEDIGSDDIKQIVNRLSNLDEPSALMSARYLRKGLSKEQTEQKEFTKTITDNLYNLRDLRFSLESDLLKAISALCMPKRTGANVRSVVTYNFDDLLERQLKGRGIQYHCIFSENESYHPDELPVFHVHGFLPENSKEYEGLDKSTLVFSEEGYHQIYSEAYHWSNLVQLNNLRENNCLMVGLSMTDPNLRRLLDISARNLDKPRHFAFMRRTTNEKFIYEFGKDGEKKQVIQKIKVAEDFLDKHHRLNEEIMKELGVTIIWFTEFDEIPKILGDLLN